MKALKILDIIKIMMMQDKTKIINKNPINFI